MPGGSDVLIHLRRCLEAQLEVSEEASVVLDLDLRNAFPSLEWGAIEVAVAADCPDLSKWTAWCHQAHSDILLPQGTWMKCNRGSEQGDPLGQSIVVQ